ncbi:hypothetical protein V498_07328 [Pseudogymnoascus sp. VKM F-4517 (FW-2822)]|nr:hypothetical protein V498_07328 [Pseudogymnoascus sp. VKM F-4517 (FW-2822)]
MSTTTTPTTTPSILSNPSSDSSATIQTITFGILSAGLAIGSIILAYLQLVRMRRERLERARDDCEMSGISRYNVQGSQGPSSLAQVSAPPPPYFPSPPPQSHSVFSQPSLSSGQSSSTTSTPAGWHGEGTA